MTCSLVTYRSKIGSFNLSPRTRSKRKNNKILQHRQYNIFLVLLLLQFICIGNSPPKSACGFNWFKSPNSENETKNVCSTFTFMTRKQHNKLMHSLIGNKERRGKGINCMYWNKGSAFLENKQVEIGTLIKKHKPHFLDWEKPT